MQAGPLNGAYAQCMRWPSARESDLGAAIVLALLSLAGLFSQRLDRSLAITRKADVLGVVLTLGATLPLAAAHARPRTVTVVCFASVLVATALGYPSGPAALSPQHQRRRRLGSREHVQAARAAEPRSIV